jgi:hypothetical protein
MALPGFLPLPLNAAFLAQQESRASPSSAVLQSLRDAPLLPLLAADHP